MVQIKMRYEGNLRVHAQHGPSHSTLHTDAPVDNQGKGESFSPTDLVATGLGSCMATIMGIYAEREGLDLRGMEIDVVKRMSSVPPRRIRELEVDIKVPVTLSEKHRQALENAAKNCPVAKSIHPEIVVETHFRWKDAKS